MPDRRVDADGLVFEQATGFDVVLHVQACSRRRRRRAISDARAGAVVWATAPLLKRECYHFVQSTPIQFTDRVLASAETPHPAPPPPSPA